MLLTIDAQEPEGWLVAQAANVLRRGGVAVIPTDTVYALACCLSAAGAVRRIYDLKDLDPKKPLSLLVDDIAQVSRYTRGFSRATFRAMKRALPGPFTLVFEASSEVPKIMLRKRKTVGIRIPDSPIVLALLAELGEPLISTSVRTSTDEWINDPALLESELGDRVDLVVDGGLLLPEPSTVIDFCGREAVVLRHGKGDVEALGLLE